MNSAIEFRTDYHIHSTYSPDGQASIEAICRRALALGFDTIAITDHIEWQGGWGDFARADDYMRELDERRRQFAPLGLTVLSGVEMGNPHDHANKAQAFLDHYPMEVRIASLHWLYDQNIHLPGCFKGRNPQTVYADYFVALRQMVEEFESIDVVAHFDRILMRGSLIGAPFDPRSLESSIRDVMATIAGRGVALELNTRLLEHVPNWRPALTTMLQWYVEEGGSQIVVDSDSHELNHLGSNLKWAGEILQEVGLKPARLSVRDTA